jgi:hypothetical protein
MTAFLQHNVFETGVLSVLLYISLSIPFYVMGIFHKSFMCSVVAGWFACFQGVLMSTAATASLFKSFLFIYLFIHLFIFVVLVIEPRGPHVC